MNNKSYLHSYIDIAPVSLAVLRAVECRLLSQYEFRSPVLDLGCGDGVFSSVFFDKPIELGVDLSLKEIERCKQYKKHHKLIACDARSLPIKTESYQTVFSNGVLEHIPHFKEILSECRRVLAPNGKLIFTLPEKRSGENYLLYRLLKTLGLSRLAALYARKMNELFKHCNLLTKEEWRNHLKEAGFKMIDCVEYADGRLSAVFEIFLPLSLPTTLTKKILGRWVLFPRLRHRFISPILVCLLNRVYQNQNTGHSLMIVAEPA